MFQLIVHGRGGQGAKTLAMLLAEAAIASGKYAQAYPEFGPERTGAPVRAFLRVDSAPIITREPIVKPDMVVILDESLLAGDNTVSVGKSSSVLINSNKSPAEFVKVFEDRYEYGGKVYVVDTRSIVTKYQTKVHFSAPLIGRIMKITELLSLEEITKVYRKKFAEKLGEDVIDDTVTAIEDGYAEP